MVGGRGGCGVLGSFSAHNTTMSPTDVRSKFSTAEKIRYSRQMLMPEVGPEGQAKLKEARVLCVGAGGLGSPLLMYLAAAGVGTLGIVDFDKVDASNLHRQILFDTEDEGRTKLEAASERLEDINPEVEVELFDGALNFENAERICESFDVVADGTDNFAARYAINEACVRLDKPNVHGAVFRFDGQVSVFDARTGPCYRCIFPEPPPPGAAPSCAEAGVLGVLPGVVGSLQAVEVLKIILGEGEPLVGRIITFDALTMRFEEIRVSKDSNCPTCGPADGRYAVTIPDSTCAFDPNHAVPEVSPTVLADELARGAKITLLDVREPFEREIAVIGDDVFIPLGQLSNRMHELDKDAEIVAYCHMGMRSANAVEMLENAGFKKVRNLRGGVDAWADFVDPSMARY